MRNVFLFLLAKIDSIGVLIAKEMDILPHSVVYHQLARRRGEMPVWLLLGKAPRLFSQPKQQQMGLGDGKSRGGWGVVEI